jgi:hypothetical protein
MKRTLCDAVFLKTEGNYFERQVGLSDRVAIARELLPERGQRRRCRFRDRSNGHGISSFSKIKFAD